MTVLTFFRFVFSVKTLQNVRVHAAVAADPAPGGGAEPGGEQHRGGGGGERRGAAGGTIGGRHRSAAHPGPEVARH